MVRVISYKGFIDYENCMDFDLI